MRTRLCLLLLVFFFPSYALTQETSLGGHIKYQGAFQDYQSTDINNALGPEQPTIHDFDIRLKSEHYSGAFEFSAHTELLGIAGDGLDAMRQRQIVFTPGTGQQILPDDDRRLFDLTIDVSDDENFASVARLDRLFAGYTRDSITLRAGRQAVSWGNGLVFQVLDPYNPFSPVEVDRDYKAGDDLLYAQWLFSNGSDIQGLVVPRRNPDSRNIKEAESSFAAKYHGRIESFRTDVDVVLSRHFEDTTFGLGISRDLAGALFRSDINFIDAKNHESIVQLLINVDRSWSVFEKNLYGFVEYFHNESGISNEDYTNPDQDLIDRLARGELFTLAKNYIASGVRLEATPLVNLFPSVILNLDDTSGFAQFRAEYDFYQDLLLTSGINFPFGGRGSEFGGIPISGTDLFLTGAKEIYLRLSYFF